MSEPVFVAEGIEKAFGENVVLRGVGLTLRRGEVLALLGENGAGKSTLMRILLGLVRPDRGRMTASGAAYGPRSARDARAAGIMIVPQERTLCPHLTVLENIVLGIEPARSPLGIIDARASRAIAARALGEAAGDGARISLDTRARDLPVADQQLVEIARALGQAAAARVLVLDEPTSSLGREDAARLFERVAALKSRGLAVVLVTHFLADVRDHADRYVVLRDGNVVGEGDPRTTPSETIVHEMLGRELAAELAAPAVPEEAAGEVLLSVSDLAGPIKPERASFVLHRGEILGIAGLVGSGRTELLRAVLGLDHARRGHVERRAPRGVGLLSEDRGGEGLMLDRAIADNVTLSPRSRAVELPRTLAADAARWIAELAIRARGPDQRAGELSGGNQQKVQVARLLREDFDVLLVDEPTRGIDVGSKAQILGLLRDLARRGKGIVLVSSQLDELLGTCDRIAVLKQGALGPMRRASEWTEEKLLLEAAS